MTFKDQLADDMAEIFCNDDEYGEVIVFGKGATGTERDVAALVYRGGVDASLEVNHGVARSLTVLVARKAAPDGILATEIENGDYFRLAWEIGGTVEKIMIPKAPTRSQTPGALEFQFNRGGV